MNGYIPLKWQVLPSHVHTKSSPPPPPHLNHSTGETGFDAGCLSSWWYVVEVFRNYFTFIGKPLVFSIDLYKIDEIYFVAHFVRFMDTRLIRTPQYYGEFVLSLRKEIPIRPLHFSKFSNLSMPPSVSVLIGFNCAVKPTLRTTETTDSSLLRTVCFVHWDREFLHFL